MSEVDFTFRPRPPVEEPLYLDSAAPRAAGQRSEWGFAAAADRPLQLDLARREPHRKKRTVPLVLACGLTFVLAAAAGAILLEPQVLRDPAAALSALMGRGGGEAATQPVPAKAAVAAATAEAEAAPAQDTMSPPAAPPDSAATSPAASDASPDAAPVAARPAKTKAPSAGPRPRRAAERKTRSARAGPAHAPRATGSHLDLDALEKSLR